MRVRGAFNDCPWVCNRRSQLAAVTVGLLVLTLLAPAVPNPPTLST
jgi:hypothetical protein